MARRPSAPTITVDPGDDGNAKPAPADFKPNRSLPSKFHGLVVPQNDRLDTPGSVSSRSPTRRVSSQGNRVASPNIFLDIPRAISASRAPSDARPPRAGSGSGTRSPQFPQIPTSLFSESSPRGSTPMTSQPTSSVASENYGTFSPSASASASASVPWPDDVGPASAAASGPSSAEENPFSLTPAVLFDMIKSKSLAALQGFGGPKGLADGLLTDLSAGLSIDEVWPRPATSNRWAVHGEPNGQPHGRLHDEYRPFQVRQEVFGVNSLPDRKVRGILQLMLAALNDKVLTLLCIVAAISLALGLYQSLAIPHAPGEPRVEWVDGVTIMVAVMIVVVVGALNDHEKEQQFARLNKKKEDRFVNVVRSGKLVEMSVHDVLCGDLLQLEPGDIVPVDGVLISGHGVKVDESSITGEAEQIEKHPAEDALGALTAEHADPFIISGSKTLEGLGMYLVTGVGTNSTYGRLRMISGERTEVTPLQQKLSKIADRIAMAGVASSVILFLVLTIKFLVQLPGSTSTPFESAQIFLRIFIVSITLVVLAVPEGLPLAVTLALAIATVRMLNDNNLVRVLAACETMGNATTICCDKTGTLTMNRMKVVAGQFGLHRRFVEQPSTEHCSGLTAVEADSGSGRREVVSALPQDIRDLLVGSIAINSIAFEGKEDGRPVYIGSRTEAAILEFANDHLSMRPLHIERANSDIVDVLPFSSIRKYMATVVRLPNHVYRIYFKGAPEILLERSIQIIRDTSSLDSKLQLTGDDRDALLNTMASYADSGLRTLGFACKDVGVWPLQEVGNAELLDDSANEVLSDLTFLGIIGIQDPPRPGVQEAVALCQHAGVTVRMVTGDNMHTAKAIAKQTGILCNTGIVLEGTEFRRMPKTTLRKMLPQLQVLARSSPEDKKDLVQLLKEEGEIVAVTGDGTNDGPALRTANVGFAMGIAGTEVAKEASSIILMDDNFASIVKAIEWGRSVNDVVKKFLRFQLTVNISAVSLTFITAIASDTEESTLTPVQLLWLNLIMDTFAALALATDSPQDSVLDRKPEGPKTPLIDLTGWKMIIGQAIYQLVTVLTLKYAGNDLMGFTRPEEQVTLGTLVFNSFVWMQFFNLYNNRRLDNKLNILEGVLRNPYFLGVNVVIIAGQVLIICFGGSALSATQLSIKEWIVSLSLGLLTIPVGFAIRCIPIEAWLSPKEAPCNKNPSILVSSDGSHWNRALEYVRADLQQIRPHARSLRLQFIQEDLVTRMKYHFFGDADETSPLIRRSSSSGHSRATSVCAPTVMAGLIAGSVAGWPSETPERQKTPTGGQSPFLRPV